MVKRIGWPVVLFTGIVAGVAAAERHPIFDLVAGKVREREAPGLRPEQVRLERGKPRSRRSKETINVRRTMLPRAIVMASARRDRSLHAGLTGPPEGR